MKLSLTMARLLLDLQAGKDVAASKLLESQVHEWLEDGVLKLRSLGAKRRVYYSPQPAALAAYLANRWGIADLHAYIDTLTAAHTTRADAVIVAGESKLRAVRTFPGFLVQTLAPVEAVLQGRPVTVAPMPGTCWFIQAFEEFVPMPDVTIVGIENGENFQQVHRTAHLFDGLKPMFVSRYPHSNDLLAWLQHLPNPYLHFGDLDFDGIRIFQQEYARHLGPRASFFIPPQTEMLLARYGNRELFHRQRSAITRLEAYPTLQALVTLFHKHGKVLEQEVFLRADLFG